MITSISGFLFSILSIIFNFILLNRVFPTPWITSLINATFKNKSSRHLAVYFRPISLVHMLSKLLDFILLSRFKKWFKPADEQSAYQSGRSCADNIFFNKMPHKPCKKNVKRNCFSQPSILRERLAVLIGRIYLENWLNLEQVVPMSLV